MYVHVCIGTCTHSPASVGSGAVEDRKLATHVTAAVKRRQRGKEKRGRLCVVRNHIYTSTYTRTFLNVYVMDLLCRVGGCGSEPVEDGGILASGTAAVMVGRWREREEMRRCNDNK